MFAHRLGDLDRPAKRPTDCTNYCSQMSKVVLEWSKERLESVDDKRQFLKQQNPRARSLSWMMSIGWSAQGGGREKARGQAWFLAASLVDGRKWEYVLGRLHTELSCKEQKFGYQRMTRT